MGINLVVFDVDGTLTATADVDSRCFAEAVSSEFGIEHVDADWTSYSEFTDSMIIDEIFRERFGRRPGSGEISRLIGRFLAALSRAHGERPQDFAEIPGAAALVDALRGRADWRVAIATGGWERSARLKLAYASIDADGVPLAAADDSPFRAGIVTAATERAAELAGQPFERVVLVGDTLWDVSTAAGLGRPFLGVGVEEQALRLRRAGASAVVPDFADTGRTLKLLETVVPPVEGGTSGDR